MKKFLSLFIVALVLVSYQNCAKQGFDGVSVDGALSANPSDRELASEDVETGVGITVSQIGLLKASDLRFVESPEMAVSSDLSKLLSLDSTSSTRGVQYQNVRLIADLNAGSLSLVDYSNVLVKRYCLPAEVIASIKAVLDGAGLCKTTVPDEQICTTVRKNAHTFIHHKDGVTINKLGESSNGCGQGKVELCGEAAAQLANIWQSIKVNKESYSCP